MALYSSAVFNFPLLMIKKNINPIIIPYSRLMKHIATIVTMKVEKMNFSGSLHFFEYFGRANL